MEHDIPPCKQPENEGVGVNHYYIDHASRTNNK
jgi:hypothetical protein